jgi:hypothetical protein
MKAARVILAIVLPLVAAVIFEALWPHHGADRAFVFVVAVAISIALALAVAGAAGYPPSVQQAIDATQDVASGPPPHAAKEFGCLRVLIACALVLLGLIVLLQMMCGGKI